MVKLSEIAGIAERRPGAKQGPDMDLDVCMDQSRAAAALAIWFNERLPETANTKRLIQKQKKHLRYLRSRHNAKKLQEAMRAANKDLNLAAHDLCGKPHWHLNEGGMQRVVEHIKGKAA